VKALLTLLKIVVISVPLTWLWLVWGRDAYGEFFLHVAMPIYGALGLTDVVPIGARDRFINYLPFLILMLITPRIPWRRRLIGIAVGFTVIFCVHLVFVYIANPTTTHGDAPLTAHGFMRIVPANALSDSIPFVLWVVLAREFVWEKVAKIFPAQPPQQTT
jgi:hypothetical protein